MAIVRLRADSKPRMADCWSAAGAASSTWKCTPNSAPVAGASGAERGLPGGGTVVTVVVVVLVVVDWVWITSRGRCDLIFASREEKTVSSAEVVARSKA